jgi:cation diffusion facilitator family transporter
MHRLELTASNARVKRAITISLMVSALSLIIKVTGYFITSSNTVLSDAAESVVHLLAVAFSFYGVWLSMKPADATHTYGHERIEFLSVGAEGSVIFIAGIAILYQSILHLILGITPDHLAEGMMVVAGAGILNLALGMYLMRVGRQEQNNILIGNGKHTLTDVWTSGGVVVTLVLIHFTGLTILDSIVAMGVAAYIMFEGGKLMRFAIRGIMDTVNEDQDKRIRDVLSNNLPPQIRSWHKLRHRTTGRTTWVELHVLMDDDLALKEAHRISTLLEKRIMNAVDGDAVVTLHMEPEHEHEHAHGVLAGINERQDLDHNEKGHTHS